MKSRTYAGVVCKRKLVGGSDRDQRMHEIRSFYRHGHMVLTSLASPSAKERRFTGADTCPALTSSRELGTKVDTVA